MAASAYFETVQKIYIAFYQRPADPAGLKYWAEQIDKAGGNPNAVITAFGTSDEAQELYGDIDADTIGGVIDAVYQAAFGRAAEQEEIDYWAEGFNAGTITASSMALAVVLGAQNDDLATIDNKLEVANEFTAQVDGRPLTDAGFGTGPFAATYEGTDDAVAARDVLVNVTADPDTILTAEDITTAIQDTIADEGDPIVTPEVPTFTLAAGAASVAEGSDVEFTLTASVASDVDQTFQIVITGDDKNGTVGITKADDADFVDVVQIVVLPAGETEVAFSITPDTDNVAEGFQGFKVSVLDADFNAVAASGTVVITDVTTDTTAPTIAAQTFAYAENQVADAVVATVVATDDTAVTSFSIKSGNADNYFAIDNTGKITITAAGVAAAVNNFEAGVNTTALVVEAKDAAGNATEATITLNETNVGEFTTGAAAGTTVKLNFDAALKAGITVPVADFTVTQGTSSFAVSKVDVAGTVVTLTLASAVAATGNVSVNYTGTSLVDANNVAVAKQVMTAVPGDIVAPTATIAPVDGATAVAANANIVLTFDEAVVKGAGNITLINAADATQKVTVDVASAEVSISADGKTVTINPAADLAGNVKYNVAIPAGSFKDAAGNNYAGSVDYDFTTAAAVVTTPGQTFALTTLIDVLPGLIGSAGTNVTSGDDTIIGGSGSAGGASTLGSADVINAGTGIDTLKLTTEGAAAVAVTPNLTSVEKVFVQATTTGAAGTTVNMVNATGTTEIWNERSTDATALNVTNVQELATVGVKGEITGAGVYNVSFKDSLASGANDSITVALDGATIADLGISGVTVANEFENITFDVTGKNTVTALTGSAVAPAALAATKTVTVKGAGSVTVTNALAATVTSVDASTNAATGGASFDLSATGAVTAKGGLGADTFKMGANLTTADVLTGGEGTDTIGVTTGASLVTGLQVTGFETLDVGGGNAAGGVALANNYDLSKLAGITTLKVGSAINADAAANDVTTINNLAKGAGVEINAVLGSAAGDQLVINVKDAGAGSPNDSINVLVKANAAFNTTGDVVINDIETVNLTADRGTATTATTHTVAALAAAAATTVAVKASTAALTITNLDALSLVLFDSTASTTAVSLTTGADAFTALAGVAFKLGAAADTLVLTGATTTGGDFFITGGAGGDAITLSTAAAEVDHVIYTAAGESNTGVVAGVNQFDRISTFATTEDKINLKAFGFTGASISALKVGAAADINAATGELAAGKAANFFGAGADMRAVVIVDDTADTWIYVDANKDGSFNAGDLAIEFVGLTGGTVPVLADFVFA